MLRYV